MELEKYRPSMPIEVLHSWADDAQKEIESLRAQLAAANAEVQEQARLNGMGAEREAKLRAQLAEVTRKYEESVGGFKRDLQEKLDQQRTKNKRLETKLLATQAHAARTLEALRLVVKCCDEPRSRDNSEHDGLDAMEAARSALSTPINLDALHEDRAEFIDDVAKRLLTEVCFKMGSGSPYRKILHDYIDTLREQAAAHRAKKEGK